MKKRIKTTLIMTIVILFNCYCMPSPTLTSAVKDMDLSNAQLGDSEAMLNIKNRLDPSNPDDIPMIYYWTAKLCWKKVLKLENPKLFMFFLEHNLDNDMIKTTYGLCKLINLEGLEDDNFIKQKDDLCYHNISPEQFKNNVSESIIYKNMQEGLKLLYECNNPYAAQEIADYYLRDEAEKDWDKAIFLYHLCLKMDPYNAEALSTLSHCYYHGYAVTQDFSNAVLFWERLYSKGVNFLEWEHRDLRYLLGKSYYEGIGVTLNKDKGINYLKEGAKDNDAECTFALGNIAYVNKDYKVAYNKYIIAKDLPNFWNNSKADIYLALSRANRFGQGVTQNPDSASYYWEKAREFSNDKTTQVDVLNLDDNYIPKRINPQMIFVKGGEFMMGATPEQRPAAYKEEYPVKKVRINDFFIGKYEVTQEEWENIMGYNPSGTQGATHPVDNVSWIEIKEFIARLNKLTEEEYYLPSEAEWEFAARGGINSDDYKYVGSNNIDNIAWYSRNSHDTSHPVGTKGPNSLGIYDMAGNVWEWCEDWNNGYGIEQNNDAFEINAGKVRRGGSYSYFEGGCRTAFRGSANKGCKFKNTGFRLCKRIK